MPKLRQKEVVGRSLSELEKRRWSEEGGCRLEPVRAGRRRWSTIVREDGASEEESS